MLKPASPERPVPATPCPACGSRDVHTTSKTVNASTYWRCGTCGEIWNAERRQTADPYRPRYR